jgi:hypothetical protein
VSVNTGAFAATLAMAVALLIAACDKERCEPAPQTAKVPDQSVDLRKAAENSVRISASKPDSVRFRGVQVWPQAVKNQFAVCGQANVFGPSSNTYVLFVVVITRNDIGDDPTGTFKTEARVGSTVTEATKVYVDTLVRCYESGGPENIMRGSAPPVPPMPSETNAVLSAPTPSRCTRSSATIPSGVFRRTCKSIDPLRHSSARRGKPPPRPSFTHWGASARGGRVVTGRDHTRRGPHTAKTSHLTPQQTPGRAHRITQCALP